MTDDPNASAHRSRNRMLLVLLFAMFFGSMLVAGLLRFSGWRPQGLKNNGELLDPPSDLRALSPRLLDGGEYVWKAGERTWRIVVAPPADCGAQCETLAREINTVWQLFGKDADEVHVLWACPTQAPCWPASAPRPGTLRELRPDASLRAGLPRVDDRGTGNVHGVPAYVIDPYGFVILRYPPGFDPAGLRADVARLIKVK
ncbi:hypothetical protein QLQ15_02930 [Lysobacter sp. LF1]|uniref:Thioredoxin domain-containing protein n=1 Tax=Lysobacter stagni TaxID=3045172 RepID=A0ABT6XCJ0_9GAMM|nr:hypothetical protein [Lysobacter sp. LF1]MDI9237866.1 hypothetical protein [Lysobacter sp. LF1]